MKRRIPPDDVRLWRAVTETVKPFAGREPPPEDVSAKPLPPKPPPSAGAAEAVPAAPHRPPAAQRKPSAALHGIEPNRARRIVHGREEIGARLDLHGLDQDQAVAALESFLLRAHREGHRAVLVITGRGRMGSGILRRRAPEWFASPGLRSVIAGVSPAHRRHGGDGAFYVALKRRDPG